MTNEVKSGVVLAGGSGSRLSPTTNAISKHLIPIYDKPLIYYPISVLMLAGIRRILLITTPIDLPLYRRLLGDGSEFGIELQFATQSEPRGVAESLIIAEEFVDQKPFALILADNIFYGQSFSTILDNCIMNHCGATIFAYPVKDPERFGVVEIDDQQLILSIEEKPRLPKSNLAVTGLYLYDASAVDVARTLQPSERGELEISDINEWYRREKSLKVEVLGRGFVWMDAGTPNSMLEATHFVQTIQNTQGYFIACLEEIGLLNKWLTPEYILSKRATHLNSDYGKYILSLVGEK